ncbi:hypothetical protein ACM9XA_11395 [Xanthomonas sacchari]
MAAHLTIRQAVALISRYREAGLINQETAERAVRAARDPLYYGNRITATDRARMLALRFGIVDTDTPVQALLQRAGGAR